MRASSPRRRTPPWSPTTPSRCPPDCCSRSPDSRSRRRPVIRSDRDGSSAFALYLVAGACWIPVVFIQLRLRDLARASVRDAAPLPPAYRRLWNAWLALGWPAFAALAAAVWLMIARPA